MSVCAMLHRIRQIGQSCKSIMNFTYFSDQHQHLAINCNILTSNMATTCNKKACHNALAQMCFANATSPLTKVLLGVIYGCCCHFQTQREPKGSMKTSPVSKFYGCAASSIPPQPQLRWSPAAPAQSWTAWFRLSISRHSRNLSGDSSKKIHDKGGSRLILKSCTNRDKKGGQPL